MTHSRDELFGLKVMKKGASSQKGRTTGQGERILPKGKLVRDINVVKLKKDGMGKVCLLYLLRIGCFTYFHTKKALSGGSGVSLNYLQLPLCSRYDKIK